MLTTHSEWVLDTLANIVNRSRIPSSSSSEISENKVALRPDQVGVWQFKLPRRPKGSVIEELCLDEETGTFDCEFDQVSIELHNEWASITTVPTFAESCIVTSCLCVYKWCF